jgi:hypothetical protein
MDVGLKIHSAPGCNREFSMSNQAKRIDSNFDKDGENLRPVIKDIPEAVEELNTYQTNKKHAQYAAYVGTLGLLVVLGGYLGSEISKIQETGQVSDPPEGGAAPLPKDPKARIVMAAGGAVAAASFAFSFIVLRSNEAHLKNAANTYNEKNKENPLELRIDSQWTF